MVDFATCLNAFLSGAICMLLAVCIQPEIIQWMNGIKRKAREPYLPLIVGRLNNYLNELHDLTFKEEQDETICDTWSNIDECVDILEKELVAQGGKVN